MNQKKGAFLSASEREQLLATPDLLAKAFTHFGNTPPDRKQGQNFRLECLNSECTGQDSSYGQLSIEDQPPFRIQCFSCDVRGDIFELLLLLQDGRFRRARGADFQAASEALRVVARSATSESPPPPKVDADPESVQRPINVPLIKRENAASSNVLNLHNQGTVDVSEMSPAASKHFRPRQFLTPELCAKWGVFYVPNNAKSTLRGRIAYHIENIRGELLAIAGRDPKYEEKIAKWKQNQSGNEPIKTRFPSKKFFHRSLELFGQQSRRLDEDGYREAIRVTGLWVVEGFNDVLALDFLKQPSLGLMSNRITDAQVDKLVRFREQTGAPGITILLDQDEQGRIGAAQVFEKIGSKVPVLNGWTTPLSELHEPEQVGEEQLRELQLSLAKRWHS